MDDLVVIILTLIVAVVGTIGQIKKKKQAENAPVGVPGNQNQTEDFWDVVDDKLDFDEKEIEISEPAKREEVKIENKPYYQFKAKNEGSSILNDDLTKGKFGEVSNSKHRKNFSLRKAVIYSEILNRKYN